MDDPSNTSVTTDWHVHTGRIALRLPSGSTIFPTASEISRAEFKNLLEVVRDAQLEGKIADKFAALALVDRLRAKPGADTKEV